MGFDVDWPDELTAESAADFAERYEPRYVREAVVTGEYERFEGPSANAESAEERGAGYGIELSVSWATWNTAATTVEAKPSEPAGDPDPVPVEEVAHELLRELAREAVERDEEVVEEVDGDLPDDLRDALDDLPADWAGRYVDVGGTVVRFATSEIEIHGDGFHVAAYYVDERVLRRLENPDGDADPADGVLLECRE